MYRDNIRALKYRKQAFLNLKEETDSNAVTGHFITPFSITDRTSNRRSRKKQRT